MLYLGILDLHETNYIYFWRIFLVAAKKGFTFKWLQLNHPTLEEWKAIVIEICKMETLTLSLKLKGKRGLFYGACGKNFWILRICNVKIDIIISQYCKFNIIMQGHHYTVPYPTVFPPFFFMWFCSLFFSFLFPPYCILFRFCKHYENVC